MNKRERNECFSALLNAATERRTNWGSTDDDGSL